MDDQDIAGRARPSRGLVIVSLGVWALLALVLPLLGLSLNALKIAGFPAGFWVAAQGSLIGLGLIALLFTRQARGDLTAEGWAPAARYAGEAIASLGFIGVAGLIAAQGYDGLAIPLGLAAGLTLAAFIVAPRYARVPAETLGGFFAARFGGAWPGRAAVAIVGVVSVLLLAADVRGGGLALQGMTGVSYRMAELVIGLFLAVLLAVFGLARLALFEWLPKSMAYLAVLTAFLTVLVLMALAQGWVPVPHLIYGQALQDAAGLEQKLLEMRLADVKSLRPLAAPFLQLSMVNFAGILLSVALGIAVLPHLISRHLSGGRAASGAAPRRAARASILAALFLAGVPAFAVLARENVARLLVTGVKTADVPAAMLQASGFGWFDICGIRSASVADVAAACSKLSGQKGLLRLQDIAFSGDGFLFASSLIAGLPAWASFVLLGGALLAAAISGHAITGSLAREIRNPNGDVAGHEADQMPFVSVAAGLGVLALATLIAINGKLSIVALATDGLALAAAGLFPAIVMSLYWRRMTAAGALAAMAAGFGVTFAYIAGVRLLPDIMANLSGALSTAPASAVKKFADLNAALAAATDEGQRDSIRTALVTQAEIVANWWGLKPGAAALLGVPAGFVAGAMASVLKAGPTSSRR